MSELTDDEFSADDREMLQRDFEREVYKREERETMNPPEEATPRIVTTAVQCGSIHSNGCACREAYYIELEIYNDTLKRELAQLRRQVAETEKELAAMRILAADPLSIQKVKDEFGPLSLWTKTGFTSALAAERAATIKECAATCEGTFSPYESKTGCCDAALDKAAAAIRALGNTSSKERNTDGGTQG